MTAAHELGHLVLHWRGGPRGRDAEHEADQFGSAFLMPRGSVITDAPRSGSLPELVAAKHKWKVAVANLAYRLHAIGLLTDWQYRSLFIEMGRLGYRHSEPEEMPRETSQVLTKMLAALREDGASLSLVAKDLAIPQRDLDAVVFGLVMVAITGEGDSTRASTDSERPSLRVLS